MTAADGPVPERLDTRREEVLRVVVINGSPNEKSKTVGLTDLIVDILSGMMAVESKRVDVYRLGPGFTDAHDRAGVSPAVERLLDQVEQADLLIAASPVYRGSYTGLFKHFFDLIDQYALANKPAMLAATGGGDHHALVLEYGLRPLLAFFQAFTIPVAIFASAGDFDGTTVLNPRIYGRIELALTDVREVLQSRARPTPARSVTPDIGM